MEERLISHRPHRRDGAGAGLPPRAAPDAAWGSRSAAGVAHSAAEGDGAQPQSGDGQHLPALPPSTLQNCAQHGVTLRSCWEILALASGHLCTSIFNTVCQMPLEKTSSESNPSLLPGDEAAFQRAVGLFV